MKNATPGWPEDLEAELQHPDGSFAGIGSGADFDLFDLIMLNRPATPEMNFRLSLTIKGRSWIEGSILEAESWIRYDILWEDHDVELERISQPGKDVSEAFIWSLRMKEQP